jgi:hypothetical protein
MLKFFLGLFALAHTVTAAYTAPTVTCTGTLIEVAMVARADFPMSVIYDNTDSLFAHTCVLDVGPAGHWPLKGLCQPGMPCTFTGPYVKLLGSTYFMRFGDRGVTVREPLPAFE